MHSQVLKVGKKIEKMSLVDASYFIFKWAATSEKVREHERRAKIQISCAFARSDQNLFLAHMG